MELKQEQQLVHAAQCGDEQALGQLYDAYVDRIYRYVLYRVSNPEIAEDLTSEVFLRVVEGLPGYQDREIPFVAWLYRIAHSRLVDYYRKSQRQGQHEDIESVHLHVEDDLDNGLIDAYNQEMVQEAMCLLTIEQQQVVHMRFIEGYNLQQSADALGKTVGAVKVMQHRAFEALSRAFSKQGIVYES